MTSFELPATGLALFFMLGLRHGCEPDHIAAIDGMTLRAVDRHEKHAAWIGTLFALGHGVAVAALAVAVSLAAASFVLPRALLAVFEWLPVLLLVALGTWNLRALLAPGDYRPDSLRLRLMPRSLRDRTDLWGSFFIGLLFALVIDTVVHISAWSVFATTRGGWPAGVAAGALFSLGMLATSSADSQLIARLLRAGEGPAQKRSGPRIGRVRRAIGWFVVGLSFAVALQAVFGMTNAEAAPAAHAHEHGVVKLDIAIEAHGVTVQMESPLDNLVGIERAPRSDAERSKVDAVVARLKAADALFQIDPAAGCTLAGVGLRSAPLKLGKQEPGTLEEGHADLDGDFAFNCKDGARAAFIDLGLFSAFAAMQRVEVQIVTPTGQLKRTLRRPETRVTLTR